jgi:hypothetical protein
MNAAPLVRATLRRINERAMQRLAERLAARATPTPTVPDATG